MYTVSLADIEQKPFPAGVPCQLVGEGAAVIASAVTDDAGVLSFEIDETTAGKVTGLRFDPTPPAEES